jgi:hypothetical protein
MKRPTTSQVITKLLPKLTVGLLPLFVLVLLLPTLLAIWPTHIAGCASILLAISGAGLFVYHSRTSEQPIAASADRKEIVLLIFAIGAANWLTLVLNHTAGMGAVIASAVVGLAGGILFPKYGAAIYCGSFVGMSSRAILPDSSALLISSLITGAVFALSEHTLNGIGGKLGTIAFIGSVVTALALQLPFSANPLPNAQIALIIVIFSVLAALLTWALGNLLGLGAVVASALVGLAGGLILPRIFPADGALLAVAVFCASFTGMSSSERFSAVMMMIAGLLTGIIFVLSLTVFGGAGGKLGMTAFSASLATLGYQQMAKHFYQKAKARKR